MGYAEVTCTFTYQPSTPTPTPTATTQPPPSPTATVTLHRHPDQALLRDLTLRRGRARVRRQGQALSEPIRRAWVRVLATPKKKQHAGRVRYPVGGAKKR